MANFTLEIQLAPNVETLLNALIAALTPKRLTDNPQFPPPSPAEQAARMRMQHAPVPQQPVPTYAQAPVPPPQYPTYPAPYAMGSAPVVPTAPPTAPIRNQPPVNPTPAPVNAAPAGPLTSQPAAAPSNPVPTAAAPAYERDQLARATAALADAGKMDQIHQLWQRFNMQRMDELPKERYGEYATALRGLGVRI